jgi:EpsI family protein
MKLFYPFSLTIFALGSTIAVAKFTETRRPDALARNLNSLPMQIAGWNGSPAEGPSQAVEAKLLATEYLARVYRKGDHTLDFWIAFYAEQKAGETMHSPKACLPGGGWEPVDYGFVNLQVPGRGAVRVNRYLVQKDGQRIQVVYWYQSKQRVVASEYTGKAFLVWDSILGRSTGGALVRLTMPDRPGAIDEEITFGAAVLPEVQATLVSEAK